MVANTGATLTRVAEKYLRKDLPAFEVGDTVRMMVKVQEADKIRLHPFEGTVISIAGAGIGRAFTVRKTAFGEGVERIFPIHSPVIESLKVIHRGITKRSKLYYLRDRVGKKSNVKRQIATSEKENAVVA